MKEKGFTLIELLGVIVILSIIMLIAIPNVSSTLENNKRQSYLTDAKKLIIQAEYALRTSIQKPNDNQLLIIKLEDLGTSDVEKDPDGDLYDAKDSYVAVVRKDGYLTYYVNLVAYKNTEKTKNKGIQLVSQDDLDKKEKLTLVKNNIELYNQTTIKSKICSTCSVTSPQPR